MRYFFLKLGLFSRKLHTRLLLLFTSNSCTWFTSVVPQLGSTCYKTGCTYKWGHQPTGYSGCRGWNATQIRVMSPGEGNFGNCCCGHKSERSSQEGCGLNVPAAGGTPFLDYKRHRRWRGKKNCRIWLISSFPFFSLNQVPKIYNIHVCSNSAIRVCRKWNSVSTGLI